MTGVWVVLLPILVVVALLAGVGLGWSLGRSAMAARVAAAEASAGELRRNLADSQQQQAGQTQVLTTLAPVAESVRRMQEKVDRMEQQRHEQGAALAEQIRATRSSVEESRRAAETLAGALKNSQVRGAWGEVQLQTLVETAGLLNRVDFETQVVGRNADGVAIKPDMVVHLPAGKTMAVDAKAPGGDYFEAHADGISPEERAQRFTAHAMKVRAHVTALARKSYWTGIGDMAPEFTVAFIPSDAMLTAAFESDPSLLEWSYSQGVILTSPSSLFALLKTVAFGWQSERVSEDARVLLDLGKQMYDRVARAAESLAKLGRSLQSTVTAYNGFVGTMETRVLPTARKFNALDESQAFGLVEPLDGERSNVRELVAPEFGSPGSTVIDIEIVER